VWFTRGPREVGQRGLMSALVADFSIYRDDVQLGNQTKCKSYRHKTYSKWVQFYADPDLKRK
jgi:hypothetical protein